MSAIEKTERCPDYAVVEEAKGKLPWRLERRVRCLQFYRNGKLRRHTFSISSSSYFPTLEMATRRADAYNKAAKERFDREARR